MFSRLFKSIDRTARRSLPVLILLFFAGCGDFFAKRPTEYHAERTLRDLSRIEETSGLHIPLPEIYRAEPRIKKSKDGVKLFYFTKNHTVDKLAGLVSEQLGYKVSQSLATNQLIVGCPTVDEAKATIEFLDEIDVPPIQIKIDCLVSELYADKTMDWETTVEIKDLFGEQVTLGGKEVDGVLLPAFPGAALRDAARAKMGLKVGYWRNKGEGNEFRALVDMLESRGYLEIVMNPTLEVVNGKKAIIRTSEHVPLPVEVAKEDTFYNVTEYIDVVDSLEIIPYAFADGSIGLETKVQIGSKATPEGVKQVSILTQRDISIEENRIKPGDSLIIGGIRKSEKRSVVRGVPFLKDLPILGILFSSKDYEERAKEIVFIITPTISAGGIPNREMVERIRKKHETQIPASELQEVIMNPFGSKARSGAYRRGALEGEDKAQKMAAETEELRRLLEKLTKKLDSSYPAVQKAGGKP